MLELSQLDVEPVEVQKVENTILLREQNNSLETLTTGNGENDVKAIITLGILPANIGDGGGCCCTPPPVCCPISCYICGTCIEAQHE